MKKLKRMSISFDDKTDGIVSAYANKHGLSFGAACGKLAVLGNQSEKLKANLQFEEQLFGEDKLMLNEKRAVYFAIRTGLLVGELAKKQLSESVIEEQEAFTKQLIRNGWYYTNGDDDD